MTDYEVDDYEVDRIPFCGALYMGFLDKLGMTWRQYVGATCGRQHTRADRTHGRLKTSTA